MALDRCTCSCHTPTLLGKMWGAIHLIPCCVPCPVCQQPFTGFDSEIEAHVVACFQRQQQIAALLDDLQRGLQDLQTLTDTPLANREDGQDADWVSRDDWEGAIGRPTQGKTFSIVTGLFHSRLGDWVAVPSADGTDDTWGIRHADEPRGQSIAQMLWKADAELICRVMNAYARTQDPQ